MISRKDSELIADVINDLPLVGSVIPHQEGEEQRRLIALRFVRLLKDQNSRFIQEPFLDRALHGLGRETDG
jgi:hypothetical protein